MSASTTLGPKEAPVSTLLDSILSAHSMQRVDTGEGSLVVNHRSWPAGTDTTQVDVIPAAEVTLTTDGRRAVTTEWHTGPEADWVFVERWTAAGRVFHGWVDSASRKLLQTG